MCALCTVALASSVWRLIKTFVEEVRLDEVRVGNVPSLYGNVLLLRRGFSIVEN